MTKEPRRDTLSVDDLRFDPENPRLPSGLDGTSEEDVLRWMLRDGNIPELMGAIGKVGYFQGEPVLVVAGGRGRDGFHTVVEGNRRLAAVKLLRKPRLAPTKQKTVQRVSEEARYKPDNLPVLIFDAREDILDYLGYRHVTGIKAWGPLAKARYLEQLVRRDKGGYTRHAFQELARTIGSKPNYVARLLTGLIIYRRIEGEGFFGIEELDESTFDFSLLTTALSYENIVGFLGLKAATDPNVPGLRGARLGELTCWVFEKDEYGLTRLGESRNFKKLNRIVANPPALKLFRASYSIEQADLLTEGPLVVFQKALRDGKRSLENARDQMHLIGKPTQPDVDLLEAVEKLARMLREWAQNELLEQ
ncbi:hypothetical protein ACFL09_03615 [Planctomycetota bacterium]